MSEVIAGHSETQRSILDRSATIAALRQCSVDIDSKDWDGLSDEMILEIIAILADGYGFEMTEVVKESSIFEKGKQ